MAVWESIASLARLAPTPHNTQPFRILPRDDRSADLVALTDRFLSREDHGNLYVLSAFGTFAACLERSAQHFGHTLTVTPVAALNPATVTTSGSRVVLGRATITGACVPDTSDSLLDARRTSRLPYHHRSVDARSVDALVRTAARGGHRLIAYDDPRVVAPVLRLNAQAVVDNLQLDDEREEIRGWYRLGATPEHGDGLWQQPMNQPAWEIAAAFALPHVFSWPGLRQFAVWRYLRTQRGTPSVGLLCGAFQHWPELYAAGRVLLDVWLEMARHDVYMQPMGSMLTNPTYAAEIARRFGVDDCWLVFRFGYSDRPPRAPRLENILIDE
jgi:nitroreductase